MSHKSARNSRIAKKSSGFRLQDRDLRIARFVAVHGYVTTPQLKLFAFEGWNDWGSWESVSEQAVYRRLKVLCDAGLLEHQRTWYGDHGIYRATRGGLEAVGLDLAPARLDRRDYEHDLRVVDLALGLTDYSCDGWITERLIRSRIRPGMSIGRVPDGLILGPGGERWAVELEVSGKEAQRYYDVCDRYADRHRDRIPDDSPGWDPEEQLDDYVGSGGEVDGVVWYFFSDKKRRRALAAAEGVIANRHVGYDGTDHLHFRFNGADPPSPPLLEKWEEQRLAEREAQERERRRREEEHRRREAQARRRKLYQRAWNYLTEKERERAVKDLVDETMRHGRHPSEEEKRQAIIDAGRAKHRSDREREERKRRRKDAVRRFLSGQ
ncbi:MAG: hypothetical protein CYG60_22195 [Actinobacteria bacterium]|nr:hypothetical protein [Actinomycetota bacterium]PLS83290.1 MAG: hypothetical protein CYG60_22195 [Actinomycetota bacterium]